MYTDAPFQPGDFVQRIARPSSPVYKVVRSNWAASVAQWFYDVEQGQGEEPVKFNNTVMSTTEYHVVADPSQTNLTLEQREILSAATYLLATLESSVPRTTVHYLVEQLKADLRKLTTPNGSGPFRRAWVGNVKTNDKEN